MKYFSTFTGIGGFELGITKAYELHNQHQAGRASEVLSGDMSDDSSEHVQRTPTCIGYSEIDKYATQVYQKHFPNHKNYGDITKINAETLPDFDLLVGGFPCQAFSIAGKRAGFDDTRGTLFFEVARILGAKRPRLLVLENVKGLLSHDGGRTFEVIIATLDELGYDVQWQVLNSKNHGVPQNRERIYIVGHLRGTPRPQVFPLGEINQGAQAPRSKEGQEVANTVRAKVGGPDLENSYFIPEATKAGYAIAKPGDSINLSVPNSKTRRGRIGHGLAQTLDTGMQQYTISKTVRSGGRRSPHGSKQNWDSYEVSGCIRRLTPLECERLQGFPDGWTEGISDTQRYKCLGNAVTTKVVESVMSKIIK